VKLCESCKRTYDDTWAKCINCDGKLTQLVLDKVVEVQESDRRPCPYCKELVLIGANRCPHCKKELGVVGVLSAISSITGCLAFLVLLFLVWVWLVESGYLR